MKKKIITIKILLMIAVALIYGTVCFAAEAKKPALDIDDSLRLSNIVKTLLMPEIRDAVNAFYSQYLTDSPAVVPFFNNEKITAIKGGELIHEGTNNSQYSITVEVMPYLGPHVSVGRDRVTLRTDASGYVEVEKFEHLESYELPPHMQSYLIKPLP